MSGNAAYAYDVNDDWPTMFCKFHRCSFLELRFTERREAYWSCPECEKEEYLRKYRLFRVEGLRIQVQSQ